MGEEGRGGGVERSCWWRDLRSSELVRPIWFVEFPGSLVEWARARRGYLGRGTVPCLRGVSG